MTQPIAPSASRRSSRVNALRGAALGSFALGLLFTTLFVAAQVDQMVAGTAATSAFLEARRAALAESPNQSLWSGARKDEYRASLSANLGEAGGILSVPAIDLMVPIFTGTSDLALNRGVGWIEGTAHPGDDGNVGLAGHRDGFFRGLKDLTVGDALELQTFEGSRRYRVTELFIVEPEDVFVLDPTPEPSVTLVTCYPFYFVGHAPERYIVRGVLDKTKT